MRMSTEQKQRQGTLRKHREQARKKPSDPCAELDDAREAIQAMKQNLKLATADIAKRGLMVKKTVTDSHGKVVTVERINDSLKIQREALRAIASLKKQIAQLQEEAANVEDENDPLAGLDAITKSLEKFRP